jgi:2,4-dienoyl-CoA reductase-like NADH-dependent reductase (Old Yellow Enzyme family)/thioredoxin reductase
MEGVFLLSYELLLSPGKIGTLELRNRVVMTAAEMSMSQPNGKPTERLMSYYEERAKGGVGLIIPGICRVNDYDAVGSFTQLAMSHDYHIEPMRVFAARIHAQGAKLGIQLHHAGRQGYASVVKTLPMILPLAEKFPGIWKPLYKAVPMMLSMEEKDLCFRVNAPSVVERSYHVPSPMRAMTTREVKKLIKDYISAAVRCQKAGVDIVELHAAHGYLIQQFLSPNTNHRSDEYGGSFKNRLRFLAEIVTGIKAQCGKDYPLMVRLSVDEMYDRIGKPGKGYNLETGKQIAKRLEELGVDAIDVSSACYDTYNYWLEPTSFLPGWRAYLAKAIKEVVNIPVVAANLMRSPDQAEQQLRDGVQDFIGSARSFICDPYWVRKVEEGRTDDIRRCIGCLHCIESFTNNAGLNIGAGLPGECALNPEVGHESEQLLETDGAGRHIVVIGAGPAGLKAAEVMAKRGYKVTLFEKDEKPGGQVITASNCLHKDKLYWCIEDLLVSVKKLGVDVQLGQDATVENIVSMNPFAVILATGGEAIIPKSIKGITLPNVCVAPDIIMGRKKIENKNVVVVGSGMTGLETTEILNEAGNKVTVIDMADEIAPDTWFQLRDDEMSRIEPYGTVFMLGKKLMKIEENQVIVEDTKTSQLMNILADEVVLSIGVKPVVSLYAGLKEKDIAVYKVGDAISGGMISDAVHSAYETARKIH